MAKITFIYRKNGIFRSLKIESMVDSTDMKIIGELEINSRASFAAIGKKIFLSPSSVRERIKKMEDSGVIKSYGLELDQSLLGNSIEVFIMLKIFSGKFTAAITEIKTFSEVKEAFRITGQHNIHMRVALRDQLHLQQFIDRLLNFGEPTTHLILSEISSRSLSKAKKEIRK